MPTFFELFNLLEKAAPGPQNHEELLAHYPDEESRNIISHGLHPATLEPLPVHLRPGYQLHSSDPDAIPLAPDPVKPTPLPAPHRLMEPGAGGKDKWGRPIHNPDEHPEYLRQQDDIRRKMTGGRRSMPGYGPEGRPGYRVAPDTSFSPEEAERRAEIERRMRLRQRVGSKLAAVKHSGTYPLAAEWVLLQLKALNG